MVLVTERFEDGARRLAALRGRPSLSMVVLPHEIEFLTQSQVKAATEEVFSRILAGLVKR